MGVTGLWQVLQPCARPIKLETLNRKRLAVDASIWIYQFLKAVRDKEGNALRNSHVVGFFRRICKLLFFGIKPVFVFDGGAPALKRQTIRARKARREGRREDAVRTAGKLLAVQMQRRAEDEEARRIAERDHVQVQEEEHVPDEGLVYVDELQMTQQERQQNRKFKKKDQYHLPDLDVSLNEMGGPNDPRIMSLEDLQAYARQFDTGEDINVYDFSKIDYDSSFFQSLPPSDRYNILNAARLRSRLRMGYSKEQLDSMFPDRMAFSKFQIERVRERNELTQRLMHLEGFQNTEFGGGRIAGEKGREYVLVRNDGVEGGWALGVITEEGREEKPIDVDKPAQSIRPDIEGNSESDDDFEDIPIEGLNRLPKKPTQNEEATQQLLQQRRAVHGSRRRISKQRPKHKPAPDPNSLFVQDSEDESEKAEEDVNRELFGEDSNSDSESEELRKAIAMSMEDDGAGPSTTLALSPSNSEHEDVLENFQQIAAEEKRPLPKGSGRAIANIVNKRAFDSAPESREITSFGVPTQRPESSDEEDSMDLQAALAESRSSKRKTSPPRQPVPLSKPVDSAAQIAKQAGFQGPLPFEKLDLGTSLLGKKKMEVRKQEAAGGFENPLMAPKEQKKTAEPLPPWFSGDIEEDLRAQKAIEDEDRRKAREFNDRQFQFQRKDEDTISRRTAGEVIDLETDEFDQVSQIGNFVDLEREDYPEMVRMASPPIDKDVTMSDVADELRAEPPTTVPLESSKSVEEEAITAVHSTELRDPGTPQRPTDTSAVQKDSPSPTEANEGIEWSESEKEDDGQDLKPTEPLQSPAAPPQPASDHAYEKHPEQTAVRSPSEDIEFEDVNMQHREAASNEAAITVSEDELAMPAPDVVAPDIDVDDEDEFDDFSDPEEAEMVRNLTLEAEEHARFASSLNNKTQAQNIREYEQELKQLRNQQKKDRRDADEVTQIMIQECQALLRLFGLPYVTAPMEAEAQCAELVQLGLVDGIVTDDSDCFLFGGTRIYKNMFNQGKFVECYLITDLEREFGLTRKKLISLAQLLGSDYTDGVPGVGHVTATEIISEFSTLEDFKTWYSAVQMNQISKEDDATNLFRKKFRKNASKLFLPSSFPDARVELAYENPEVDSDPEAFQWGVPDLESLRSFLMATIGWSQERTDEVLVPVIKDMNRRADEGTQANITAFFDGTVGVGAAGVSTTTARGEGFAPRRRVEGSKRMGSALTRMAERAKQQRTGGAPAPGAADEAGASSKVVIGDDGHDASSGGRGPMKRKAAQNARSDVIAMQHDFDDSEDESDFEGQKAKKSKRRAKAPRKKKAVPVVGED